MWWWLRSAQDSGGGSTGYVVGEINNKANSAQLELELGLSLANSKHTLSTFIGLSCMIICPNLSSVQIRSYLLRVADIFLLPLVPSSVLKLETSCQKEIWCQGHSHTSWSIGFWPRMHARSWSRVFCFDCFFHNLVIFSTFSTFSGSNTTRNFYEEEGILAQHRRTPRLVRALVFMFRKCYLFKCISLQVLPLQAGDVT